MKLSVKTFKERKANGHKITVLTGYDYIMASLIDQAGVDAVLVGDSLANVILGLETTKEIGMREMLHHAKAVARAVKRSLVIGDMPYGAYQPHEQAAVDNAKQFIACGCDAVKIEWFEGALGVCEQLVKHDIAVMGHVGLTPQTAATMTVQGRDEQSAQRILQQAVALERSGCFAIVLECIPSELAKKITAALKIPTIGIGAGVYCDGQVLVSYDLLGLVSKYQPKFVKQYVDLKPVIINAFKQYIHDVSESKFPDDAHSFRQAKS